MLVRFSGRPFLLSRLKRISGVHLVYHILVVVTDNLSFYLVFFFLGNSLNLREFRRNSLKFTGHTEYYQKVLKVSLSDREDRLPDI